MKTAEPTEKKKATRKETSHQGKVANMRPMPLAMARDEDVGAGRPWAAWSVGTTRVCLPGRAVSAAVEVEKGDSIAFAIVSRAPLVLSFVGNVGSRVN